MMIIISKIATLKNYIRVRHKNFFTIIKKLNPDFLYSKLIINDTQVFYHMIVCLSQSLLSESIEVKPLFI